VSIEVDIWQCGRHRWAWKVRGLRPPVEGQPTGRARTEQRAILAARAVIQRSKAREQRRAGYKPPYTILVGGDDGACE
jgi:hypothetical protein